MEKYITRSISWRNKLSLFLSKNPWWLQSCENKSWKEQRENRLVTGEIKKYSQKVIECETIINIQYLLNKYIVFVCLHSCDIWSWKNIKTVIWKYSFKSFFQALNSTPDVRLETFRQADTYHALNKFYQGPFVYVRKKSQC